MSANILECLNALVLSREISSTQAADIQVTFEHHRETFAHTMTMSAAERAAAEKTALQLAEEKALQKRQRALHIQKADEILGRLALPEYEQSIGEAAISHLTKSKTAAPWANVEYRKGSWEGILRGLFIDGIDAFRSKTVGLRQDKAGLKDFVQEAYRGVREDAGADTGNATAKGAAKSWADMTETARLAANQAGADIKKRFNWVVPNVHSTRHIHRAGFDTWVRDVLAMNVEVLDEVTGLALKGDKLGEAVGQIYRTLESGGMDKLAQKPFVGQARKLANRMGDPRTLQFKDAEGWLAYNEKYGSADIFGLLMSHINQVSRDIAMLEVLGPNPEAMIRQMKKTVEEAGEPDGILRSKAEHLQNIYDVLSGRLNSPVRELWYRLFGGTRNVLSTAMLGRAPLSAVSDIMFLKKTAAFNGLPSMKVLANYAKSMSPTNHADRILASRQGIVADSWTARGVAAARYQDELLGDGWTAKLADTFHRVTGLTQMTEAGRKAFGQEFFGYLADNAGKALDELDGPLKRAFKRHGITSELWDAARKVKPMEIEVDGVKVPFMELTDLARSGDANAFKASQRLHEMILQETDLAVPSPDARTRALLVGSTRRGTFWGEVIRSVTMYKSFSVTVMHTHWLRGAMEAKAKRYGYLPSLMVGLTVMGGASVQMKEIAKGRDPRDMSEPSFAAAAFMQGGGLGIYGDFLYSWLSRAQGTALETSAGPLAQLALTDAPRLSFSNARQLYAGEDTGFAAEMVRFIKRYMPFSNVWYLGLAFERTVFDQMQMMADPKWARSFQRMENRARKNTGQEYYWAPGDMAPERGPDAAAAVGMD